MIPGSKFTIHLFASTTLVPLLSQLNVTRRFLRLFRFIEAFQRGWRSYVSTSERRFEDWLDILAASTFGIYGLLESATMLDMLKIPNLAIFGTEQTKELSRQAQIYWFTALYATSVSSGIKLIRVLAYRAVPDVDSAFGAGDEDEAASRNTAKKSKKKLDKEEQLKKSLEKRVTERKAEVQAFNAQVLTLSLAMVVSLLDMILPAAAVGWIAIEPGWVGIAMLCTTLITTRTVWKNCGKKLESQSK